jgi:hypothetical protein
MLELGDHPRHRDEDRPPQVDAVRLGDGHADVEDDDVVLEGVRAVLHDSTP